MKRIISLLTAGVTSVAVLGVAIPAHAGIPDSVYNVPSSTRGLYYWSDPSGTCPSLTGRKTLKAGQTAFNVAQVQAPSGAKATVNGYDSLGHRVSSRTISGSQCALILADEEYRVLTTNI